MRLEVAIYLFFIREIRLTNKKKKKKKKKEEEARKK